MSVSSCCPTVFSCDTSSDLSVVDAVADSAEANLSPANLSQVITDILATGSISRSNQRYLLDLTRSNQFLSGRDVVLINRVFHRLQIGLLRVVND
jgi:hypothetical protein